MELKRYNHYEDRVWLMLLIVPYGIETKTFC